MKQHRNSRHALRTALAATTMWLSALGGAVPSPAQAADYPDKRITVIVPYSAGTGIDVLTRSVGKALAERLGQPIVVDNRPGASGNMGIRAGAKAAPDGYTLVAILNTFTINPAISAAGYDAAKDFEYIGMMTKSGMVLVTDDSLKASSLPELVDLIRKEPGKYFYASTGIGSPQHMSMELFKRAFGLDVTHVPHGNAAEANVSLLAGQTNMMFMLINIALQPLKTGRIKALAAASATRDPNFPDLPTVAESGAPGFDVGLWYGLVAPAGTPKPVVDKLTANVQEIMKLPEIRKTLDGLGMTVDYMAPQAFRDYVLNELVRWNDIAQTAKVRD